MTFLLGGLFLVVATGRLASLSFFISMETGNIDFHQTRKRFLGLLTAKKNR
jgi:hypothetical protein